MLISYEDRNSLVKEFEARFDAIKAPVSEDFANKAAHEVAYTEFFEKRDALKEEFDDMLIEKGFAGLIDLPGFDEISERTLELAKESEYGAHFDGLAAEFFAVAELVRLGYAAGKGN